MVRTTNAFALKPQGNETNEHPGAVQNSHRNLPKAQQTRCVSNQHQIGIAESLFGDSHVEFFEFPKETPNWIFDPKPDPGFRWW